MSEPIEIDPEFTPEYCAQFDPVPLRDGSQMSQCLVCQQWIRADEMSNPGYETGFCVPCDERLWADLQERIIRDRS